MTTYSYSLVLDDGECYMLGEALKLMVQHCNEELSTNPRAPYLIWKLDAERVQARLYDNMVQTSGYSFIDNDT